MRTVLLLLLLVSFFLANTVCYAAFPIHSVGESTCNIVPVNNSGLYTPVLKQTGEDSKTKKDPKDQQGSLSLILGVLNVLVLLAGLAINAGLGVIILFGALGIVTLLLGVQGLKGKNKGLAIAGTTLGVLETVIFGLMLLIILTVPYK